MIRNVLIMIFPTSPPTPSVWAPSSPAHSPAGPTSPPSRGDRLLPPCRHPDWILLRRPRRRGVWRSIGDPRLRLLAAGRTVPPRRRREVQCGRRHRIEFGKIDLASVAVHETGNLLGLGQSSNVAAIMYPTITSGSCRVHLGSDNVQGIQQLYGANSSYTAGGAESQPRPSTQESYSTAVDHGGRPCLLGHPTFDVVVDCIVLV